MARRVHRASRRAFTGTGWMDHGMQFTDTDLFEALMEGVPFSISFKDADGRFICINSAMAVEFGLTSREEAKGKTDADFFPEEFVRCAAAEEATVIRTGQASIANVEQIVGLDGRMRWFAVTRIPMRDSDGRVCGLLRIRRDATSAQAAREELERTRDGLDAQVRDRGERLAQLVENLQAEVSERRQAEERLNEAMTHLREHDGMRSRFVSQVSHELKAPLASMQFAVGNLLQGFPGPFPDRARAYLDMIREDCDRLDNTIEDVLEMSRIEAGRMVLERVIVPLQDLVGRAACVLKYQAESKQIDLALTTGEDAGFVFCDPQKIERVLINVIGNAVKYAPDGGPGIPPEHIAHVTEWYYRIDEHAGGAGLGLAIANEITVLHGGRLEFRSPPADQPHGTEVSISIPVS